MPAVVPANAHAYLQLLLVYICRPISDARSYSSCRPLDPYSEVDKKGRFFTVVLFSNQWTCMTIRKSWQKGRVGVPFGDISCHRPMTLRRQLVLCAKNRTNDHRATQRTWRRISSATTAVNGRSWRKRSKGRSSKQSHLTRYVMLKVETTQVAEKSRWWSNSRVGL